MEKITIHCTNDGKDYDIPYGITLGEAARMICRIVRDPKTGAEYPVLAALLDHKLKGLDTPVLWPHEVTFIGYNHDDGRRTYIRSLQFVLQKAVREIFPDKVLMIEHALPSGLYCEIVERQREENGVTKAYPVSQEELDAILRRMRAIVSENQPFSRRKIHLDDALDIFRKNGQPLKVELQKSLGRYFCSVYYLDELADSFHGPLVLSSGILQVFGLVKVGVGFCLQPPSEADVSRVVPVQQQERIAAALKEYSDWCRITRIDGVGSLNKAIHDGRAVEVINTEEARQERRYAEIADAVARAGEQIKIVFIAGPSSSGKTSSSLRIAQQCRVLGLRPKVVELDNYFVDRDRTPRDADGNLDFECLEAMDLQLLGEHLNTLLAGGEVEIPRFDFPAGMKRFEGNFLHLEEKDILIMEGIHALDPAMVPDVDNSRIYRIYTSCLTSFNLDENNCLSTSDNRLLRRIVRDNRVRGITPEGTLLRWHSVRRGEGKYIFPFQEHADVLMNTALIYEFPLLKYYAEPLLRRILPSSPAYTEAVRLLKFLEYVIPLQPSEIAAIPPTSIMREFIGGQTL